MQHFLRRKSTINTPAKTILRMHSKQIVSKFLIKQAPLLTILLIIRPARYSTLPIRLPMRLERPILIRVLKWKAATATLEQFTLPMEQPLASSSSKAVILLAATIIAVAYQSLVTMQLPQAAPTLHIRVLSPALVQPIQSPSEAKYSPSLFRSIQKASDRGQRLFYCNSFFESVCVF